MPRASSAGSRVMPAPRADAGVAEDGGEAIDPQRHRALPPTSAPCEPVTMIWPASSGAISEAESISTMRRRQLRLLQDAARLLARLGIAVRWCAPRPGAGPPRGRPCRARRPSACAGALTWLTAPRAIMSAASPMRQLAWRGRGGRHAQRLRHGDHGDARLVLAHARIVVDDGARMRLEREVGRIAPAVRAGDDHARPRRWRRAWWPYRRERSPSAGRLAPRSILSRHARLPGSGVSIVGV